jgi:hypothetical protein
MAKMVVKTMLTNAYATIRPFFDEIAEDCSILSVSNDESTPTTLILTIDTDFVITIPECEAISNYSPTTYIGKFSILLNGNSLYTHSSVRANTGAYPMYIICYSDTFFLFIIRNMNSSGSPAMFAALYEKIGNNKYGYGATNIASMMNPIISMDNTAYTRGPYLNYKPSDLTTIDYMDKSAIYTYNTPYTRYEQFDDHFLCCTQLNSNYMVLTIDGHDYFALTTYLLIPIDDE